MSSEQFIRDFFARNGRNQLPQGPEALGVAYLDAGIIDSLGIITMVSDIEDKFAVHFSADDMQSYEFQTVGGLIGIVDRLVAGKQ